MEGNKNSLERKEEEYLEMTKHPLNCILYGPPGTGKTHYTVLKAAEIIENRTIDSYDEALKIFKANLHNQIEFITFSNWTLFID
jgi:5-methylcytosine-specific restriction protein B